MTRGFASTLLAAAILVVALGHGTPAVAMPADPNPATVTQPDGTRITVHLYGDEWLHWYEDDAGYLVLPVGDEWRYARLTDTGVLVTTEYLVGKVSPGSVGLRADRKPAMSKAVVAQREANSRSVPGAQPMNTNPAGTVKNLVILCLFSDHTVAANARATAAYDSLFNTVGATGPNAPTGGVEDYYLQASYGLLSLQSTVIAWVTLPHPESYYANGQYGLPFGSNAAPYPTNAAGMVHDALALLDASVNFASFDLNNDGYVDAIDFIHSGYGGEQSTNGPGMIWSHKYNLSSANGGGAWASADKNGNNVNVKVDLYHTEPARYGKASDHPTTLTRVGVVAHETGHFFGLPDLYDPDSNGLGGGTPSSGIGNYCLMANSWGWDNDQLLPPLPSAWCRLQLGWVTPMDLSSPALFQLRMVSVYQDIARTSVGYPAGEYLLIENRQAVGFDQKIPQPGLAIWHIDENVGDNTTEGFPAQSGWPGNGNHYKIALLQADGKYDLEQNVNKGDAGDLYHDRPGIALSEATTPSSDTYAGGFVVPTANEISEVSAPGTVMTLRYRPAYWVDFAYPGLELGTFTFPFRSIANAVAHATDNGIVISKAGTTGEHPVLNRVMRFKSYGGVATIGRP